MLKEQSTMTPRDFCYWLQGFFELNSVVATRGLVAGFSLTAEQVEMIRKHLYVVFKHECEKVVLNDVKPLQFNPVHGVGFGEGSQPLNSVSQLTWDGKEWKTVDGPSLISWPSGPFASC
jgi:hypothetical protein